MKKLILFLFILPLLASGSTETNNVFICTGKTAYAYHKTKNCRGLKNCKGETKTITLEKAKEMKRKPCGYCYKK